MSKKKLAILAALRDGGLLFSYEIREVTKEWAIPHDFRIRSLEADGMVEAKWVPASPQMQEYGFSRVRKWSLTHKGRKKLIETPELGALWKPLPAL